MGDKRVKKSKNMRLIGPTEWLETLAVEIKLTNEKEDFLKIVETLTRIGIANHRDKVLTQSCHILHKMGKYYIVHFKELLALDGKPVDIATEDILRRNRIVALLQDWNMLTVVNPERIEKQSIPTSFTILRHSDKFDWTLNSKYKIGVDDRKEHAHNGNTMDMTLKHQLEVIDKKYRRRYHEKKRS